MKAILQSNAYGRTSRPLPGNHADRRFYSHYYPRRMMAEVLHDAIVQVSQVPTRFDTIAFPGGDVQKTDIYPLGTRAVQLYDSAVENYFSRLSAVTSAGSFANANDRPSPRWSRYFTFPTASRSTKN